MPEKRSRPRQNGTGDDYGMPAVYATGDDLARALDAARHLAENGVPIFLAQPALDAGGQWDPHGGTGGYRLPNGWQHTRADPSVVDGWKPGMALCAVMGHAVDGLDLDPRNGGSLDGITRPVSYGQQATPSGGTHDLIAPLGVGSRDKVRPGVDVKGGRADGTGRGILFLAPTKKVSKTTGEVGVYDWSVMPDLSPLLIAEDASGAELALAIRSERDEDTSGASEPFRLPERIPEGERNTVLSRYACSLLARNLHPHEALLALHDAFNRCDPPYDEETPEAMLARSEFNCRTDPLEEAVQRELDRLRVREEATARHRQEKAATADLPFPESLTAFLAVPDEDATYRVDRLWPTGGRVLLAAAQKAGKTTLMGNLGRCLADGEPFLERFAVEQMRRLVLLDNELDPRMLRRWLREHAIENTGALEILSMRGRMSTFDILDKSTRSRWAERIAGADLLIFDCLRPALDALGLSEDKEAGRFLEPLDELIAEAGIPELLVVHHMGHTNERSRGDSRLLDWPDAVWKLVREDPDDPMSARFFSAYGRDVDQSEVRLSYSDFDRRLTIDGGSRKEARLGSLSEDVLAYVAEHPGCTQNAIEENVEGRRTDRRSAIKALVAAGELRLKKEGQANRHYVASEE